MHYPCFYASMSRRLAVVRIERYNSARMYTDRRFTQTQTSYAADDLEIMSEARRYHAHVYGLMRPFVGKRVLEVGAGIGTMTADLLTRAERVVALEPNRASSAKARAALGANPRVDLREC